MKGTRNKTLLGRLKGRPEISVLCATLGLSLIFTLFSQNFLSSYNIYNVSRTAALYVFVALSQTMVMLVGGMNVSLGYIARWLSWRSATACRTGAGRWGRLSCSRWWSVCSAAW